MRKIKHKAVRRTAIAVEILVIALLNDTVGLLPELFGGRPLLLISAALSVSACEEVAASVIFGAVCGALADIMSSGGIGFYALRWRFADILYPCFCGAN